MLIPKVSIPFATTNDAESSLLRRLSIIGIVYAKLPIQKLHELAPLEPAEDTMPCELALKASLLDTRTLLGPFSSDMIDVLALWLDQGIAQVLVDLATSEDVELERIATAISELPASRLMVRISVLSPLADEFAKLQEKLFKLRGLISGVVLVLDSVTLLHERGFKDLCLSLQALRKSLKDSFRIAIEMATFPASDSDSFIILKQIQELHNQHIDVVTSGYCNDNETQQPCTVLTADNDGVVDAARSFVQCLRTDRPDGLFTTVVTDEGGVALGLVYSSTESVLAAIESRRGVYFSRSRGGLWKKGESSGNAQTLIKIDVDCDSDALRFTVNQSGTGFCHLNTRTCWGQDTGLRALESLLYRRHAHAPAGSYTKRLFDDAALLRNKLVEEAQELAEAKSIPDVAGEAADVMYFAMVRCVAAGCKLSDVEKMLDKRALKVKRRPGNSKPYRISVANEILSCNSNSAT